jgi:hypothetical protein
MSHGFKSKKQKCEMNEQMDLPESPNFEVEIEGHLSDQRRQKFGDLQVALLANGRTQISGNLRDQAQLFGTLIQIRDMGLPLISINFAQANNYQTIGDSK